MGVFVSYQYTSQDVCKNPNTSQCNCGIPAQPMCSNILSLLPFLTPYNQFSSMSIGYMEPKLLYHQIQWNPIIHQRELGVAPQGFPRFLHPDPLE